jgi:hypothetical protein
MFNLWKYMLFLALAVPAVYTYGPRSLKDVAKPQWLDDISVIINRSLAAAKPQADVSPIDPVAAANVDEDLDYRIAERTKSPEGWRSFLTAHAVGPHAQSARAELDKLAVPVTPPAPAAVQAPDPGSPDRKIPSDVVSPRFPSAGSEAAPLASDEICRADEDRLEQLSNSPTSDGVIRLLIELRCEKLRPKLLRLGERLDDKAHSAAADAAQDAPSSVLPGPVVSPRVLPPPRVRANEPHNGTRATLSSRRVQPKRHANGWTAPNLPQLLLALFGEGPRNSTGIRRTRAGAGSGGGGH